MADESGGPGITRRSLLAAAAAAGGGTGLASAFADGDGAGDLFGGTMALSQAYNVSGDLWIGPDSAKGDVDAESGRVYMASDTQVEYYGDGSSWTKMGIGSATESVPDVYSQSVTTDEGYNTDGRVLNQSWATWQGSELPNPFAQLPYSNRSKALIGITIDDGTDDDYTYAFHELQARGLPFGQALISSKIGDSNHVTQAEVDEMLRWGDEPINHGKTAALNEDVADYTLDELITHIKEARDDLETKGWPIKQYVPAGEQYFQADIDSTFDYFVRSTHICSAGQIRVEDPIGGRLPDRHSVGRIPIQGNSESTLKSKVDTAIDINGRVLYEVHPAKLTSAEKTDFEGLLDKIQTERKNGTLDVVTPSGAVLIGGDPDESTVNMAPYPGAEVTSFSDTNWGSYGNTPAVHTGGAKSGSKSYKFGAATSSDGDTSDIKGGLQLEEFKLPPYWTHIMVSFWARRAASGDVANVRVRSQDADGNDYNRVVAPNANSNSDTDQPELTTSWQRYWQPLGYHRNTQRAKIGIYTKTDEVWVDDIKIYPI